MGKSALFRVLLRLTLAQPIVTGEGEEKFTFAERMGFQSLWEHRKMTTSLVLLLLDLILCPAGSSVSQSPRCVH